MKIPEFHPAQFMPQGNEQRQIHQQRCQQADEKGGRQIFFAPHKLENQGNRTNAGDNRSQRKLSKLLHSLESPPGIREDGQEENGLQHEKNGIVLLSPYVQKIQWDNHQTGAALEEKNLPEYAAAFAEIVTAGCNLQSAVIMRPQYSKQAKRANDGAGITGDADSLRAQNSRKIWRHDQRHQHSYQICCTLTDVVFGDLCLFFHNVLP